MAQADVEFFGIGVSLIVLGCYSLFYTCKLKKARWTLAKGILLVVLGFILIAYSFTHTRAHPEMP